MVIVCGNHQKPYGTPIKASNDANNMHFIDTFFPYMVENDRKYMSHEKHFVYKSKFDKGKFSTHFQRTSTDSIE